MPIGLIGKKLGMTRIFTEEGVAIPVSVIEVLVNRIAQIKSNETDGYRALQVTTGERRANRVNKSQAGHFAKANVTAGRGLWEFRLNENENQTFQVGAELTAEVFQIGQKVDVVGVSKGKGFQGAIKRHNFKSQRASHGNSLSHRALGSTGQNQSPGRVFKGKRMPGQMGNKRCTVASQEIVRVDAARHLILIKGGVPGAPGSDVLIKPAIKAKQENSHAD